MAMHFPLFKKLPLITFSRCDRVSPCDFYDRRLTKFSYTSAFPETNKPNSIMPINYQSKIVKSKKRYKCLYGENVFGIENWFPNKAHIFV